MKRKITKRLVDACTPSTRNEFVWDTQQRGFGVKITPTGKQIYVLQYRVAGLGRRGSTKRLTLGECGSLTPDQARNAAKNALAAIATGRDPAKERASEKSAPTVREIADLFLADVDARKKPRTAYEYRRQLHRDVLPIIGNLRVHEVQRAHIAEMHDKGKSRPYAANRALALTSSLFSWCEQRGHPAARSNPCRGVQRYRESRRARYLSADEFKRLGEALTAAETAGSSPVAVAAIRCLAFGGFRESEVLSLRWDAIDWDRKQIILADSKSGRTELSVGAPLLHLLASQPEIVGNPYVFPGREVGRPVVEIKRVWLRVRREAGLQTVRLHDLRHGYASVAAANGESLIVIGALLGHKVPATTARYAHLRDDLRQSAADRTSTSIQEFMRWEPPVSARVANAPSGSSEG